MSNIYNLEPRTNGLIILKTNVGDIEIELFTKECPKATRNFVQNCLNGLFDGKSFERVEKDFIAVIDIPNDEDTCEVYKDEFHPRLKFNRRGLLATANTEKDANFSKFFFTLGATPELQNKHTIFGRAKGSTVYVLVDLNECPVDEDSKPISDKKILETIVVENPYPELKPVPLTQALDRNKLDQDEDEEYDPLSRPRPKFEDSKKLNFSDSEDEVDSSSHRLEPKKESKIENVSESIDVDAKRNRDVIENKETSPKKRIKLDQEQASSIPESLSEREKRLREIRAQIEDIKNQFANEPQTKSLAERRREKDPNTSTESNKQQLLESSRLSSESLDPDHSNIVTRIADKKGRDRERETKEMIEHFKRRLKETSPKTKIDRTKNNDCHENKTEQEFTDVEDAKLLEDLHKADGDDWMNHRFEPEEDGNEDNSQDYSVSDPRDRRAVRDRLHGVERRSDEDDERKRSHNRDRSHGHDHGRHHRDYTPKSDRKSHHRHSSHRHSSHKYHRHKDSSSDSEKRSRR